MKKTERKPSIWRSPAAIALTGGTMAIVGMGAYLNATVARDTLGSDETTRQLFFALGMAFDVTKAFIPLAALAAWRAKWKMLTIPLVVLATVFTGFSLTASMTVLTKTSETDKAVAQKTIAKRTRIENQLKMAIAKKNRAESFLATPATKENVGDLEAQLARHIKRRRADNCEYKRFRNKNPIDCGKFDDLKRKIP